ncbi:hypothetical protein PACTADRAFT_3547 [Pachysolen tannophilus NRRL Y-2460]|uniref:Sec39 domain-containing protein n=1 Tax=Pachysolen tannophilus NRRL Y-2460 TaxID=669874 RepID=A0A1E4TSC8_PACTA|nr:hypothetical protein PACTADRAFT_3547 [Pachysolen tannophilus NRRL Y-2460]
MEEPDITFKKIFLSLSSDIANGDLSNLSTGGILSINDVVKMLLVLLPDSFNDFDQLFAYINEDFAHHIDHEINKEIDKLSIAIVEKRFNSLSKFIDQRCSVLKYNSVTYDEFNFIRSRFSSINGLIGDYSTLFQKYTSLLNLKNKQVQDWYEGLIIPLINLQDNLSIPNLLVLNDLGNYEILSLMLSNLSGRTLNQSVSPFLRIANKGDFSIFNNWFLNYVNSNLLVSDESILVQNYSNLLVSIFQNEPFLISFIENDHENYLKFSSIVLAAFYLCPIVNEKILTYMKNIIFLVEDSIELKEVDGNNPMDGQDIELINNVEELLLKYPHLKSPQSLFSLMKLITSYEKLYQCNLSFKDILKMSSSSYELQLSVLLKLIDENRKIPNDSNWLTLINSIYWLLEHTKVFNRLDKAEVDLILFKNLISLNKYTLLIKGKFLETFKINSVIKKKLLIDNFWIYFKSMNSINVKNNDKYQNCCDILNCLSMIKFDKDNDCIILINLLEILGRVSSYKFLSIKPASLLDLTPNEVIDKIFELNDIEKIDTNAYELFKSVIIGLNNDDELLKELHSVIGTSADDLESQLADIPKCTNPLLLRLLIRQIQFQCSTSSSDSFPDLLKLANSVLDSRKLHSKHPAILNILQENWLVFYQLTNYQLVDKRKMTALEISTIMQKKLLLLSKLLEVVENIDYNNYILTRYLALQKELNESITKLDEDREYSNNKNSNSLDFESRVTRALASSAKDFLNEFLVK